MLFEPTAQSYEIFLEHCINIADTLSGFICAKLALQHRILN